MNRHFMMEKSLDIHPEVFRYSRLVYSQQSFLFFFYGDSVINSSEGTPQGDPVSPVVFSDSMIQDLIDSLESKTNSCYLYDGILWWLQNSFGRSQKIVEAEKNAGI